MAVNLISQTGWIALGGSTQNFTMPATPLAGDFLVFISQSVRTDTVDTLTGGGVTSWTQVAEQDAFVPFGDDGRVAVYTGLVISSPSATVQYSGTNQLAAEGILLQFRGLTDITVTHTAMSNATTNPMALSTPAALLTILTYLSRYSAAPVITGSNIVIDSTTDIGGQHGGSWAGYEVTSGASISAAGDTTANTQIGVVVAFGGIQQFVTPIPPKQPNRRKRYEVQLWDINPSDRGRGQPAGDIWDARNLKVTANANDVGELTFTIPWNHPQASAFIPYQRHYRIRRWDRDGSVTVIQSGMIDDYNADKDTVTIHGSDYMAMFKATITASSTSYMSQTIGAIITDQVSQAINETDSRLAFMQLGTIDQTTKTVPVVISAYEQRLLFMQSLIAIWQADSSVRPLLSITRDEPFIISFSENAGSERNGDAPLIFGRNVTAFSYLPDWLNFRTRVNAIGQKREGASILYSEQTYADEGTYGRLAFPVLHVDVVDQTALDNMAKRDVRRAARIPKNLVVNPKEGYFWPWQNYELMDSIPVTVQRGSLVQVAAQLFTLTGWVWTVKPNGAELTVPLIIPKEI